MSGGRLPRDDQSVWKRRAGRRIGIALIGLGSVIVYGVAGYVIQGWHVFDALYMVVITLSTVGYGELHPINTTGLMVHTMVLNAAGIVAVAYLVTSVLAFITEGEIHRVLGLQRVRKQIDELKGHVVVAGFGRMGSLLRAELEAVGESVVVIELDPERVAEVRRWGYLHVAGDATEEDVLNQAGLLRARALVTTIPNDAASVFITLTARQMAPNLLIITRAEQPSTQKKLKQAGANHVVLPAAIGAHRIASMLTNPTAVEFTELVTRRAQLAIEMDELVVRVDGSLSGRTLRDADIGRRTGVIVIAVKRGDGRLEFPPHGDEPFKPGDSIVVLGRREHLEQFRRAFQA